MSRHPRHRPSIRALLESALGHCRSGRFDLAETEYRDILARTPATPDACNMLAAVLFQQGRHEEAAGHARQATSLRPEIPPYWLIRGNIEAALDRHDDARSSYRRAIALDPTFAEAHYRLGCACYRGRRHAEAAQAFQDALRGAPEVAEIHYGLALALRALGRWEDALRSYEAAFRRDPGGHLERARCIDLMRYMQWDALPEFWFGEITRFFARGDLEKAHYVAVGLRALRSHPEVQTAIDLSARPEAAPGAPVDTAAGFMRVELLGHLLQDSLLADPAFERLLTRLRSALLLDPTRLETIPDGFLFGLALQCCNTEHVYAETPAEAGQVAHLQESVSAQLAGHEVRSDACHRRLALLAMYRPIADLAGIESLARADRGPPGLRLLLRRAVLDVLAERALRESVPGLGPITDDTSLAVRDLYETHPYPRWFALDRAAPLPAAVWLRREIPDIVASDAPAGTIRVLVAGCGTGKEALSIAAGLAGAQVDAVDLSRASLAFGMRMARELGIGNVHFLHGDLLDLTAAAGRYDVIASSGVLHHLRDPEAGLAALVRVLEPGGWIKIALYSERARAAVNAARAEIAARGIPSTTAAIREFRQSVLASPSGSPLAPLAGYADFHSISMCRDLMFHVQEHPMRLPQIAAMLARQGLETVAVSNAPPDAEVEYRRRFPDDPAMKDLGHWDALEADRPDTFRGMIHLWCRPASAIRPR